MGTHAHSTESSHPPQMSWSLWYRIICSVKSTKILFISPMPQFWHRKYAHWIQCCCCSVAKLFPTLWDPMDCTSQASLSFTISWSLLKLTSIESVMPSNHLLLCHPFSSCPQPFPASGSFPMSWLFTSGGQSIGASVSTSVLPMNIQDWFPLVLFLEFTLLVGVGSRGTGGKH